MCGDVDAGDINTTANRSVHDVLKGLDSAKTSKDIQSFLKELSNLHGESDVAMRAYISDTTKKGEKRAQVLKTMLADKPVEQRQKETIQAFSSASEPNFKGSLAQQMGNFSDAETLKVLHEALRSDKENSFVRISAALGLAQRGDSAGGKMALDSIVNNKNWVDGAIQTLVLLKAKNTIMELEKVKQASKEYAVRNKCSVAQLRVRYSLADENEKIQILSNALREDGYLESAQWAANLLAQIGGDKAAALLVDVAKKSTGIKWQTAYDGLLLGVQNGKWTQENVQKWLQK